MWRAAPSVENNSVAVDRPVTPSNERGRTNRCGPVRKNRVHLRAEARQVPGELNGLIGGDAPRDAEDDPPSLPWAPGMKYTSGQNTRSC